MNIIIFACLVIEQTSTRYVVWPWPKEEGRRPSVRN